MPGPDPDGRSYGTFATFSDPDGNSWLLQEIKTRLPGRGLSNLDVATLTELLRETEKRHGEYEPTAPKHHWSDWYAAYIVARERGRTPEEAAKDAALHMESARDRVQCRERAIRHRSRALDKSSPDLRGSTARSRTCRKAIRSCWCSCRGGFCPRRDRRCDLAYGIAPTPAPLLRSDLKPARTSSEEELRLFPGREVPAFVELVVVDEFGIRPLRPAPRGWIEFVREDAHGNRDGDAFGIEIPVCPNISQ